MNHPARKNRRISAGLMSAYKEIKFWREKAKQSPNDALYTEGWQAGLPPLCRHFRNPIRMYDGNTCNQCPVNVMRKANGGSGCDGCEAWKQMYRVMADHQQFARQGLSKKDLNRPSRRKERRRAYNGWVKFIVKAIRYRRKLVHMRLARMRVKIDLNQGGEESENE